MTAAGTMFPARVLVIGAGVAGLEAIGTARRLGAVVEAFDTRAAVKEEVQSLGARFIELAIPTTAVPEADGYAKGQSEQFYKEQQKRMSDHVATADVVITTALVRGERAPVLLSEEMVQRMRHGSVVVDVAAEQGGNCSLTEPGKEVVKYGVTIIGPLNLPSSMPVHASEMYARTIHSFLGHIVRDGNLQLDMKDEIIRATLVTHHGEIVNDALRRTSS
jgi:NAD(P) transhydrogenase subunit alpha